MPFLPRFYKDTVQKNKMVDLYQKTNLHLFVNRKARRHKKKRSLRSLTVNSNNTILIFIEPCCTFAGVLLCLFTNVRLLL